ncbi:MAG: transcription termination/antitermination protein NusA [Oscillibacter sp.]|nr:transcription termination/antitermination protein NusA [Oscillibacter sp.]
MKGKKQKEPAGMNPGEIFAALELLEKERGIPRTFMMDKIIQAITTAYKRDHTDVENVIVEVDEEHHDLRMFVQKVVVDEEDYVDPFNEVPLEEAKAMSARYAIGDVINFPVDKMEFGRIAAGNGKQVIIQGLREAERGMVYDEFNSKQHEILTGVVTRIDPRNGAASLRIGTESESTEALLLAGEQVAGETLEEGMHIKVYVVEVRRSTRGPQVLISRTHPGLVKRLFELEVPEIYDGIVEVKSIAREAGSRTKMAVWSSDENVDPIGACVGPRGQRVAAIVEELRGEKIDIIKYSDDPAEFIAAALAPADVLEVRLESDSKACRCLVPADQLSLAIGKEGQNARLAARLTSYKIDIKPQGYQEPEAEDASEENSEEPMADLPANLTEDLLTDLPADEETEEPVEE